MFEILLHLVGDRQMIRIKISMASEFLAIKKKKSTSLVLPYPQTCHKTVSYLFVDWYFKLESIWECSHFPHQNAICCW